MIRFLFLALVSFSCFASRISYRSEDIDFCTTAHILRVDPEYFDLKSVRAKEEDGISKETVLSMARSNDAYAAVNGGFWKSNGNPAGILKILDSWHGLPKKPRGAIGWKEGENIPIIDQVLTTDEEIEILPQSNPRYTSKEDWREMDYVVGGTPVLVRNGKVIKDFSMEGTLSKFLTKRYSRTAVGVTKNGTWVFVVVDGRFYGLLGGMKIKALANYMLDLGCTEALNLDGGSSSTLVYENSVMNSPDGNVSEDGKMVSSVSDAILILPK